MLSEKKKKKQKNKKKKKKKDKKHPKKLQNLTYTLPYLLTCPLHPIFSKKPRNKTICCIIKRTSGARVANSLLTTILGQAAWRLVAMMFRDHLRTSVALPKATEVAKKPTKASKPHPIKQTPSNQTNQPTNQKATINIPPQCSQPTFIAPLFQTNQNPLYKKSKLFLGQTLSRIGVRKPRDDPDKEDLLRLSTKFYVSGKGDQLYNPNAFVFFLAQTAC